MVVSTYYKTGDESSARGLVAGIFTYENEIKKFPSYLVEISEEEYNSILARMNNPNELHGIEGVVNQEGYVKYQEILREEEEKSREARERIERAIEEKIALSVKKIRKLLALEIIDPEDIDTEIEQQNMSQYRDEIRKRLGQ